MFKVNNIVNFERIFTTCSSVFTINFELVNVGWVRGQCLFEDVGGELLQKYRNLLTA